MLSCSRGLRSNSRGRIRKFHEVSESSLDSTASACVPSFDLGLDFDDQISTSQDVGLVMPTPNVVKRARTGKRVPASPIGVVVGGKRCNSFSEIYTSLAPSLIDVPANRCDTGCLNLDSFRFKEPVPISTVEYPASEFEVESQSVDTQSRVKDVDISDVTDDEGISNFLESEPAFVMIEEPASSSAFGENSSLPLSVPSSSLIISGGSDVCVDELDVNLDDCGFASFDEADFSQAMNTIEKNGTTKSNSWVRNRFNAWRVSTGRDCSVPLEDIPLKELAELLCKFFFVVRKRNDKHYPSQSVMQIYKGFNRILCQVQKDRIDASGVNEEQFIMYEHAFFGKVNKLVILAMKKSIMAGANKNRRKVDYFTDGDERKLLAHPNHQSNFPSGVQKRFAYFCTSQFFIRGNNELYNLRLMDFTLGVDEQGRETLRYDETISKNYKPSLKKYQQEHFRVPVYSRDEDVVYTFKVLLAHMPSNSGTSHLFLSPIHHPKDVVWFKAKVNLGESTLRHFVRDMAAAAGIEGDFTNKSGRVTSITRMCIGGAPLEAIAANTGHHNHGSIQRYNRISCLQARVAQEVARPRSGNEPRSFERQYEIEVAEMHDANNPRPSIAFNQSTDNNGNREEIDLQIKRSRVPQLQEAGTLDVILQDPRSSCQPSTSISRGTSASRPCFRPAQSDHVLPIVTSEPVVPIVPIVEPVVTIVPIVENTPIVSQVASTPIVTLSSNAALVEEEMRFWSEFNFDAEDMPVPLPKVDEAPRGTRFAMQKSVALMRRENVILRNQLSQAIQEQHSQAAAVSSLQQQLLELNWKQDQAQQDAVNQRGSLLDNNYRFPFPAENNYRFHDWRASLPNQVPNEVPSMQPRAPFMQPQVPFMQPRAPFMQPQVPFMQPPDPFIHAQHPFLHASLSQQTNLPQQTSVPQFQASAQPSFPFTFSQSSGLETAGGGSQFDGTGNLVVPTRLNAFSSIGPVYGNNVFNYQSFDVSRFLNNCS